LIWTTFTPIYGRHADVGQKINTRNLSWKLGKECRWLEIEFAWKATATLEMCPLTASRSWPRPPGKIHRRCLGRRLCSNILAAVDADQSWPSRRFFAWLPATPPVGTLTKSQRHTLSQLQFRFQHFLHFTISPKRQQTPKTAKSMFLSLSICICIPLLFI